MTAIFGVWNTTGEPGAGHACAAMQNALSIYGRDRAAIEEEGPMALGVTLARLTPEDRYDRQPLAGGGGRWLLVADIRLDNRPELAAALGIAPADLALMADSQLVLSAFERWEEGAIERLIGDFALAAFDNRERRLILARDFLGARPLFYARAGARLAFASMAKGIHALGDIAPAPDLDRLRDYLALAVMAGSHSFFAGIKRVCQGEVVTIHADGRETRRTHYDWDAHAPVRYATDADYVEAFRALFDRAVADRLRVTGDVCSHLSSGFDSSAVTVAAALQLGKAGRRITAYTHVPMAGAELHEEKTRIGNEWPFAHEIAQIHPNIDHVAVESADRRIGEDMDSAFYYAEYPALNLCNAVWVRDISRIAARGRHKVLLTGAVGNATISLEGSQRRVELLRSGQLLAWAREGLASRRHGVSTWDYTRSSINGALPPALGNALKRLTGRRTDMLSSYSALRPDIRDSEAFRAHLKQIGFDPTFRPPRSVRELSALILQRLDIMAFEQKAALGMHGIDTRDPTADRRLVDFVRNVPSHLFNKNGETRWIYRQAFADRFPPSMFAPRRKGYQAADWKARMANAFPALNEELDRARGVPGVDALVNYAQLEADVKAGLPDGPPTREQSETYRLRLLRALSVTHFIRRIDPSNGGARLDDA